MKYAKTPSTKKTWRDSLPIDMRLSAVSVLVVAQSSSEIPEGLMNNSVYGYLTCASMLFCFNLIHTGSSYCYVHKELHNHNSVRNYLGRRRVAKKTWELQMGVCFAIPAY